MFGEKYECVALRLAGKFGNYFKQLSGKAVVKGIQGRYELRSSGIE
jgi:hypothetical protein